MLLSLAISFVMCLGLASLLSRQDEKWGHVEISCRAFVIARPRQTWRRGTDLGELTCGPSRYAVRRAGPRGKGVDPGGRSL